MGRLIYIIGYALMPIIAYVFGNKVEWGLWIMGALIMSVINITQMLEKIMKKLDIEDK